MSRRPAARAEDGRFERHKRHLIGSSRRDDDGIAACWVANHMTLPDSGSLARGIGVAVFLSGRRATIRDMRSISPRNA
jgi:hypothetical protein